MRLGGALLFRRFQLGELGPHGLVAPGELLDCESRRLVVGQAEVVFEPERALPDLLEAFYGGVDVFDGGLELALGKVVVCSTFD